MIETLLCIILILLVLLILSIFAVIGILMLNSNLIGNKPKTAPPPISEDERARIELADKKRIRQEQNFWNYDGFKQDEMI